MFSAYVLLAATLIFVASLMNFWLFIFHRHKFRMEEPKEEEEEEAQ